MSIDRTIRCPHCQMRIEREAAAGTPLPGSPFRRCPGCGRFYYDEAYEEPALTLFEQKQPRFNYIKILYAVLPTAGALIYLRAWLSGANPDGRVPALVFGALAVFFLAVLILEVAAFIRSSREHAAHRALLEGNEAELSPELAESVKRLRDPKYLDALESYGADIPDFFRKKAGEG